MKEKIIVYINGPFKVICLLLWNDFLAYFEEKNKRFNVRPFVRLNVV